MEGLVVLQEQQQGPGWLLPIDWQRCCPYFYAESVKILLCQCGDVTKVTHGVVSVQMLIILNESSDQTT